MTPENRSIWQIRLATLSVFILGFIAGGFALNIYQLNFGAKQQQTKQERYEDAFNQLDLTAPQKIEVQQIVSEIRGNLQLLRQEAEPRLQEIRYNNDLKLQKVLTEEQWNKFQQLRESIRRRED